MPTLGTMQVVIAIVAVVCGVLSFGVYFAMSVNWLRPKAAEEARGTVERAGTALESVGKPTAAEVAEIVKALATLTQSLVKAGPALWSLIGSILFLLVAAIAAGLLDGRGTAAPDREQAAETTNTTDPGNAQEPPEQENLNVSPPK